MENHRLKKFSEIVQINEGAISHKSSGVLDHLVKLTDDFIKGINGKNGSNDPKHPDASKVNKDLKEALKLLKQSKKTMGNADVYLRNVVVKSAS